MSHGTSLTSRADVRRAMPISVIARADEAAAAVASLREEQRRLERIGFETPLARCHQQLRYWSFVHAMCSLRDEVKA